MVLTSLMISRYISSLAFYFPGNSPLISGPKMAENPKILSKMAAQGLQNTIKVKLTNKKCGPVICHDRYIHFIPWILFSWTQPAHFWPENGWKSQNFVKNGGSRSREHNQSEVSQHTVWSCHLPWPLYTFYPFYFIFLDIAPSFLARKWLKIAKFCQKWRLKVSRTQSK